MKMVFTVLMMMLSAVNSYADAKPGQTLQIAILSAIDNAPEMKNPTAPNRSVTGDPRYLRNEFSMLIESVLGQRLDLQFEKIHVKRAECGLTAKTKKNVCVLEIADVRETVLYTFENVGSETKPKANLVIVKHN